MSEPVVIVGSGLAGYSVAKQFRLTDKTTTLTLLTSDDGYDFCRMMNCYDDIPNKWNREALYYGSPPNYSSFEIFDPLKIFYKNIISFSFEYSQDSFSTEENEEPEEHEEPDEPEEPEEPEDPDEPDEPEEPDEHEEPEEPDEMEEPDEIEDSVGVEIK